MTKPLATISHLDLYGRRNKKYNTLEKLSVQDAKWTELAPVEPYYFFVPKDFSEQDEYEKGFRMDYLFTVKWTWFETQQDELVVSFDKYHIDEKNNDLIKIIGDLRANRILKDIHNATVQKILFKTFDSRFSLYSKNSSGVMWRPKYELLCHMLKPNLALLTTRLVTEWPFWLFISNELPAHKSVSAYDKTVIFPLYLYSDSENLENQKRTPNLDETIWSAIDAIVGETTPEQILDYIYAVLHSPSYREKYREFLKIDFPRVPYPRDRESFLALVALGGELRALHLLESSRVEDFITSYPVAGDNVVEAVKYVDEKVFINATQYFGGVPESVWTHPIGGYMPAQKWLKDRKGRTLTNDDIMHYQRMIVALAETARVMEEVDRVIKI